MGVMLGVWGEFLEGECYCEVVGDEVYVLRGCR